MADIFNMNSNNGDVATMNEEAKKDKKKAPKKQYLEANKMNFLDRYETVVEGKSDDIDIKKIMIPGIAVVAAVAVVCAVIWVLVLITNSSVKSLNNYINDQNNVASYNQAITVKDTISRAKAQKANTESMISAIATYPNINRAFFNAISVAASENGVTVVNYGYSGNTGYLSVSCTATSAQNISNFVRAMNATGLFANVEYNQFNGGSEGAFSFTVNCYCNGNSN